MELVELLPILLLLAIVIAIPVVEKMVKRHYERKLDKRIANKHRGRKSFDDETTWRAWNKR